MARVSSKFDSSKGNGGCASRLSLDAGHAWDQIYFKLVTLQSGYLECIDLIDKPWWDQNLTNGVGFYRRRKRISPAALKSVALKAAGKGRSHPCDDYHPKASSPITISVTWHWSCRIHPFLQTLSADGCTTAHKPRSHGCCSIPACSIRQNFESWLWLAASS